MNQYKLCLTKAQWLEVLADPSLLEGHLKEQQPVLFAVDDPQGNDPANPPKDNPITV